ncbi:hypothetical protein TI03_01765, partial [Achromatium sp. WMS1]
MKNIKNLYFYTLFWLFLFIQMHSSLVHAATVISSLTTSTISATSATETVTGNNTVPGSPGNNTLCTSPPCPSIQNLCTTPPCTLTWGGGVDTQVDSFKVGSTTYYFSFLADQAILQRKANACTIENREILLCEVQQKGDSGNGYSWIFKGSRASTMEEALNSRIITRGADNVFVNDKTQSQCNNVERIDLIFRNGLKASNPASAGYLLLDRGGNDKAKIIAVTAIDASGNPTAFASTLVSFSSWGKVGPSGYSSTVVQHNPSDTDADYFRPTTEVGSQTISGIFVSLADLGIVANQTFYGYSLFPNDVNASHNLLTLTNVPTNTSSGDGGWDIMAGGFLYQSGDVLQPVIADYGDAPDTGAGTTTGNYQTLSTDSGPSHGIVSGLKLGDDIDGDDGTNQNAAADADGTDEDGINSLPPLSPNTTSYSITGTFTNTTASNATIYGWIDFNRNGSFEASEVATTAANQPTTNGSYTLTWNSIPTLTANTSTYLRLRLTTETLTDNGGTSNVDERSIDAVDDGEVEDHKIDIRNYDYGDAPD